MSTDIGTCSAVRSGALLLPSFTTENRMQQMCCKLPFSFVSFSLKILQIIDEGADVDV